MIPLATEKFDDRFTAAARAVSRSAGALGEVSATAVELLRSRREPAAVASRKRRRANAAAGAWSIGGAFTLAVAAAGLGRADSAESVGATVGVLVILAVIFIWCVVGVVRNALKARQLKRELARLPAAAPVRPRVDPTIRPVIAELDGYSDGLRQLVGLIGVVDDPSTNSLRAEILSTADAAERSIRRQAGELTGVLRARRSAPRDAMAGLDATSRLMADRIRGEVSEYGALVSAAGDAVAASRALAPTDQRVQEGAERLRALAVGMRELTIR